MKRRVGGGCARGAAALVLVLAAGCSSSTLDEIPSRAGPTTPRTPTAEQQDLIDTMGLTAEARERFLRYNPELGNRRLIDDQCGEGSLGCLVDGRIFILRVNDPELRGVMYGTAAHELLHGEYIGLPEADRKRVNAELERIADDVVTPDMEERVQSSADQHMAPYARVDELHSYLGSEVVDLSPLLEEHYTRYFTDRRKLVEFATWIDRALEDLDEQLWDIEDRLDELNIELRRLTRAGAPASERLAVVDEYDRLDAEWDRLSDRYDDLTDRYDAL